MSTNINAVGFEFLHFILHTSEDYSLLFLRLVAGIIIFPYGMQKLLGWFQDLGGGVGIHKSLINIKRKNIPQFIGWLIIIGQSFGSIALLIGCITRLAALGNIIIFSGALIAHLTDGWAINWTGKKNGEGIEYFVLLISILLIVLVNGGGAISIDFWLKNWLHNSC